MNQVKSYGVGASSVCQQGGSLKVLMSMHHVLSLRKQYKSCVVNASCICRRGSSLGVVVSMHHAFVSKEAV